MRPTFTLLVVCSADGFIARFPGHSPAEWASPEEQDLFLSAVDAADWGFMGRGTHAAADKPHRRRVIFSSDAPKPDWRRATQLWVDPDRLDLDTIAALVEPIRPLREGLILGGTRVHDWFLHAGRIDRISLTVEPVAFGEGLPLFSGETGPADLVLKRLGFRRRGSRALNAAGTRLIDYMA